MRFTIIIAVLILAILFATTLVWLSLASDALRACKQIHSYDTCVHTLR